MFKCGVCGSLSAPREKASHAVLERRVITQPDTGKPGVAITREVLAHAQCTVVAATAAEVQS
jgi:hypothetical protein